MGESLYENGVRVRSIRGVPVSTPNALTLSTTGMSVYNSIISLIAHSSLVVYDMYSSTEYGVIQANDHWYGMKGSEEELCHRSRFQDTWNAILWKRSLDKIHGNHRNHRLGYRRQTIGRIGSRWKPHGYGTVYDEEGRKEYEGYQVNGARRALESSITVI